MRKKMPETEYRASRICRVLGNPTAYQIVKLLLGRKVTPGEIAKEMGISETLASVTLRTLRNVDIVRYETKGKEKIYWIKDELIDKICRILEKLVIKMRTKNW
ncbi:MAG: ArsR family transcriptional regulator [candidate division WOR-3 bacterium]